MVRIKLSILIMRYISIHYLFKMDAFKNKEYGINGVLHVKGKVFTPIIFAKNRCMTKLFLLQYLLCLRTCFEGHKWNNPTSIFFPRKQWKLIKHKCLFPSILLRMTRINPQPSVHKVTKANKIPSVFFNIAHI